MYIHETKKRIRYGETDQMGYLYYGNYALLYEIGRTEAIRDLGMSYRNFEKELKIMMPVMHVESKYIAPIFYDELITIKTCLREMPSKLIHFYHEILNEKGKVVHKASVKLFFIDMISNKRVSTPDRLLIPLKTYFA